MVAAADGLQIPSHPGLVGDDCRVFGVCFAVAPVSAGGVVDGSSWDVDQGLVLGFEQADQQRGPASVQVGGPEDLPACREVRHFGEKFRECGFVVGYLSGEQPVSFVVDEHAVVMSFSGVDAGPEFRHVSLHRVVLVRPKQMAAPSCPYIAIGSLFSISGRAIAGCRAAIPSEP
ncbi:hypothetical protein NCCP2145_05900 [Pseudarthrobacter sp. NCCP-2145]|nr:hypothetical protein NCCP2145_05900 [Pseudarthrobacter sp. NCCP-2145]